MKKEKAAKNIKLFLLVVNKTSASGSSCKGTRSGAFESTRPHTKLWTLCLNMVTCFDLSQGHVLTFYFTLPLF